MASATILPPSSGAENPARPPRNLPIGVRTAERMTGVSVVMAGLQQSNAFHYSAMGKTKLCGGKNSESGEIFRPRQIIQNLICGGSSCTWLGFIRARTVEARHGNTNQAEVDRELSAMVDKMVKHHPSNTSYAWHCENLFAASEQLPILQHFRIAYARKRRTGFRDVLVKFGECLIVVFDFGWRVGRAIHGCVIELLGIERYGGPTGHCSDVACIPTDSSRLVVRLPVPLFIGTAFQDFACVLHLLVEFGQHGLSNGHRNLP